jgi:DnaJ-domain-containing protein 1
MSFTKRLFNVARAELKSAARKMKDDLIGGERPSYTDERLDAELKAAADEARSSGGDDEVKRDKAQRPGAEPAHIRRYYANLELAIGAPAAEVKAAYRRLMRRYHPDLHQGDAAKAEAANKLAQELRVAYEGLLEYLGER